MWPKKRGRTSQSCYPACEAGEVEWEKENPGALSAVLLLTASLFRHWNKAIDRLYANLRRINCIGNLAKAAAVWCQYFKNKDFVLGLELMKNLHGDSSLVVVAGRDPRRFLRWRLVGGQVGGKGAVPACFLPHMSWRIRAAQHTKKQEGFQSKKNNWEEGLFPTLLKGISLFC